MEKTLKFIQFGIGPIGEKIVRYLLERENVAIAGAIDTDPKKIGKDVGDFLKLGKSLGITISGNAEQVLANSDADVVVLSTLSSFAKLEEQINVCIRYKKNIISSCEEMAFPWDKDYDRAKRIDEAAKEAGVTVLSNGVNPGFAMDALPIFLTGVCQRVDSIRVERHQDAAIRRLPFQKKIGAGLSLKDFENKVAEKIIRHVGFTESVQMIAGAMGWKLDHVEDVVKPAIAERDLESQFLKVSQGDAAGVLQTATGYMQGKPVITLELQAYLGHPSPKDSIQIEGEPSMYSEVTGGFNGDIATCAMVANSVPVVRRANPGLKTMLDVGLVSWFKGHVYDFEALKN
ncbi:MAG: dihydrodipicolinate reductase [Pseudomonadota bacterium]